MIAFTPTPREEMARRARRSSAPRRAASPGAAVRNLTPVLELGDATYFTFRGRVFGVPPLPWKVGERLLDLHTKAGEAARRMADGARDDHMDRDAMADYFAAIGAMPAILWAHSFPASRVRRALRALGLLRNPFAHAGDREIMEIADFFLARRMASGVRFPRATTVEAQRHEMFLTT